MLSSTQARRDGPTLNCPQRIESSESSTSLKPLHNYVANQEAGLLCCTHWSSFLVLAFFILCTSGITIIVAQISVCCEMDGGKEKSHVVNLWSAFGQQQHEWEKKVGASI